MSTIVQSVQGYTNSANQLTLTLNQPQGGNLLVAATYGVAALGGTVSLTVTDTDGHSWSLDESAVVSNGAGTYFAGILHAAVPVTESGYFAVTLKLNDGGSGSSDRIYLRVWEITGITAAQPDAEANSGSLFSVTSIAPGAAYPSTSGDFSVAVMALDAEETWTDPAGWNLVDYGIPLSTIGRIAWQVLPNTNAVNPSWTNFSPARVDGAAVMVAYQSAPQLIAAPLPALGLALAPAPILRAALDAAPASALTVTLTPEPFVNLPSAGSATPPLALALASQPLVSITGALDVSPLAALALALAPPPIVSVTAHGETLNHLQFLHGPAELVSQLQLEESEPFGAGALAGNISYTTLWLGGHDGQNKLVGGGMQTVSGQPPITAQVGQTLYDPASEIVWVGNSDGSWHRRGNLSALRYLASDYGITPSSADNTAALNSLLATLESNAGGEILFGPGTYTFLGQIVFPNNGASPPAQVNIRWNGAGGHANGQGGPPLGGTVFDLRYAGSGVAKIDTRGLGLLEISGIAFKDGGSDSLPFVQTTNTTLHIHDCGFLGTVAGLAAAQDALVLGGTSTVNDGSSNAAFQGYGTVIERTWFGQIRTGVLGRTFCNNVIIQNNVWWSNCGGDASHAAIEIQGVASSYNVGNVVSGNCVEMSAYVYGIRSTYAQQNTFSANGFYDETGTTQAYYRFESSAGYNLVFAGFNDSTKPLTSDANGTNTVWTSAQGQTSVLTQPLKLTYNGTALTVQQLVSGNPVADVLLEDSAGNQWYETFNPNPNSTFQAKTIYYQGNSRTVTDGVLNSTTTLTSATANFVPSDFGKALVGTGIPANTTIANVVNATTVTMSAAATASASGVSVQINASSETILQLQRNYPGEYILQFAGSIYAMLYNTSGDMKVYSKAGSTLWLGDPAFPQNVGVTNGVLTARGLVPGAQTLTYGVNVSVNPVNGVYCLLSVTNTAAFTVDPPSTAVAGQWLTFEITNSSGGGMGAVTWTSGAGGFVLTNGAWTNPANGLRRLISYQYNGLNWIELSRSSIDF